MRRLPLVLLIGLVVVGSVWCQDGKPDTLMKRLLDAADKHDAALVTAAIKDGGTDLPDAVMLAACTGTGVYGALKPSIDALPGGLGRAATSLAASAPEKRSAFLAALAKINLAEAALLPVPVVAATADKAVADAAAAALETADPLLMARASLVTALRDPELPLAKQVDALRAALTSLTEIGDTVRSALCSAVLAKALIDAGDGDGAAALRESAGVAPPSGRGFVATMLARVDLALGTAARADGRDELATLAAARAALGAKALKDMPSEMAAACLQAALQLDGAGPVAAAQTLKPWMARLTTLTPTRRLIDALTTATTIARRTGAPGTVIPLLQSAVPRLKQLDASLAEQASLRFQLGLAQAAAGLTEAAGTFTAMAALGKSANLPALARGADCELALLDYKEGREEDAMAHMKTARDPATHPGVAPVIARLLDASVDLAAADLLVERGRTREGFVPMLSATSVADQLGVRLEQLPGRGTTRGPKGAASPTERTTLAVSRYDAGGNWPGFEPVFVLVERRALAALGRLLVDTPPPPDVLKRADTSDREVRQLLRVLDLVHPLPTEDVVQGILARRKSVADEAWKQAAGFASRRFPRSGSLKTARDVVCGTGGAVMGAAADAEGGYVFAFSRENFLFRPIKKEADFAAKLNAFAAAAKDPKTTLDRFVAASDPAWNELIAPILGVLEQKTRVVILGDGILDGVPVEALVTPGTKATTFKNLPYLATRISVGRLVASSVATPRETKTAPWLRRDHVIAVSAKDGQDVLAHARLLDRSAAPDHEGDAAVVRTKGADAGFFNGGGVTLLGPGIAPGKLAMRAGAASDLVIAADTFAPAKDAVDPMLPLFGNGVRAIWAPTRAMDWAVVEALTREAMMQLLQGRDGPVEALGNAQKMIFDGTLRIGGKPVPDTVWHPAVWSSLRCWTVSP